MTSPFIEGMASSEATSQRGSPATDTGDSVDAQKEDTARQPFTKLYVGMT